MSKSDLDAMLACLESCHCSLDIFSGRVRHIASQLQARLSSSDADADCADLLRISPPT